MFSKKKDVYHLMCETFTGAITRIFYKKRLEEMKEKLEELEKTCKHEWRTFSGGMTINVMVQPSKKYKKFYNEEIVDYVIRLVEGIGVYNLKRKGKTLQVWCGRPGVIIGLKGATQEAIIKELHNISCYRRETGLDKIQDLKFMCNCNPFWEGIYNLQNEYVE